MMFITLQEVIEDQADLVQKYGGAPGIRDIGLLASAIEMPKAAIFGEYLHPTVFDKAAAYLFHIVCNHPFVDGNKRTGAATALIFLRQNDVLIRFTHEESLAFEDLVVNTANGKASKEEIARFLKKCYRGPAIEEKQKSECKTQK